MIRPGLASVPFLVVGFAACADLTSPLPLPPPPAVATAIVSETASYNFGGRDLELRDLPRVRFHLPPVPRPYDFDNPALVEAIAAADGRAMIGLRAPGATRGLQTGVREAITAAEVRTAFLVLEVEVEMLHVFPRLGQVHARLDPANAPRIRHLPFVDWVEPMSTYTAPGGATSQGSSPLVAASSSQTVHWSIDMVRAQQAWNVTRGAGPKLQIIDTGYFNTVAREDLPVIPGLNCTGLWGCVASEPAGVHGTAIASIIFARDNMVGTVGIAPDMISDSIYVHGCGSSGCDFWQTAQGFSDAVTNRVHVLNASITGPYNLSTANNVALASAEDIVMIAAAGNEFHLSQRYPAAYPEVIGVSGVYENMGFKLYAGPAPCLSSNYGDHVELAAPYFAFAASGSTSGYAEFCGTSGSAALVSGAALLLRAAEPQLNAQQVRERLRATAFHPQGDGLWTQYHGWGIVDAAAAVGLPARPRARIDGPTSIWSSGNYTWTADVSGGDGQFSYQWFRHDDHVPCGYIGDEFLVGTGPTYSEPINMQTLDFRLRKVVSSYGLSHSHHIKITVGNGQQPCPMGAPAAAAASPGAG